MPYQSNIHLRSALRALADAVEQVAKSMPNAALTSVEDARHAIKEDQHAENLRRTP